MLPKYLAATKAINYVTENIVLGLGTGSTTEIFIELLSKELKNFNNLLLHQHLKELQDLLTN
jgi:ribose 5-phosphate isomerase